jgi:sterol desaturase/sphingolipid hydroxylase (fatty acid hydroxylase superfamily)
MLTLTAFPAVFFTILAVSWWALEAGIRPEFIIATANVVAAGLIWLLERINPYDAEWSRSRDDERTDIMHLLVSMMALPRILQVLTFTALYAVGAAASSVIGAPLWPNDIALPLQLMLAAIIGEFGAYWAHRLMHTNPLLWRLHATHHTVERLYWLNAARFHPLDVAFTYMATVTPLVFLGCPPDTLALLTIFTGIHGMFQHANVNLRLGPLNYIFSMAELHRWHHSKTLADANSNYGSNIILWDIVFQTRFLPTDRQPPRDIGVEDLPDFPRTYKGQLMSPWRWPPG